MKIGDNWEEKCPICLSPVRKRIVRTDENLKSPSGIVNRLRIEELWKCKCYKGISIIIGGNDG